MDVLQIRRQSPSLSSLYLPLTINLKTMSLSIHTTTDQSTQTSLTSLTSCTHHMIPNVVTDPQSDYNLLLYIHHDVTLLRTFFNFYRIPTEAIPHSSLYTGIYTLLIHHPKFDAMDLMHQSDEYITNLLGSDKVISKFNALAKAPSFCIIYGHFSLMKDSCSHLSLGLFHPASSWDTCTLPFSALYYILHAFQIVDVLDPQSTFHIRSQAKNHPEILFRKFIQTCFFYPNHSSLHCLSPLILKQTVDFKHDQHFSHLRIQSLRILYATLYAQLDASDKLAPFALSLLCGSTKISPLWRRDRLAECYFEMFISLDKFTKMIPSMHAKLCPHDYSPSAPSRLVPSEIWQQIAKDLIRSLTRCSCTYIGHQTYHASHASLFLCPLAFFPKSTPWSFCKLTGILRVPRDMYEEDSIPSSDQKTSMQHKCTIFSFRHYPPNTELLTHSNPPRSTLTRSLDLVKALVRINNAKKLPHTPCRGFLYPNGNTSLVAPLTSPQLL